MLDEGVGTRFVECIYRLVRKLPVSDVALSQIDSRLEGLVRIGHVMVLLVDRLELLQDKECLLLVGGVYRHLLKSPVHRAILLDTLTILLQSGGTDAADLSSCKRRLEHAGRIDPSLRIATTHQSMYLVNIEDDIGVCLELVDELLHPLLKLPSIHRPRHNGRHIHGDDPLIEQIGRDIAGCDPLCQSLDYCCLSHTGLTQE